MSKINTINNASKELTIDPGASGDSFVQFDINGTGEFRIGVDDDDSDKFKLSAGSALGSNDVFVCTANGEITMPLQSAFSAYLSTDQDDVTGDDIAYAVVFDTEIFDQNSDYNDSTGYFTAPITGRYAFIAGIKCHDIGASHNALSYVFTTSNRLYHSKFIGPYLFSSSGTLGFSNVIIADMDASDTCYMNFTVFNGTKTVDLNGAGNTVTRFSGYLVS